MTSFLLEGFFVLYNCKLSVIVLAWFINSGKKMFTEPATHCSLSGEVKGAHSLEEYKLISDKHGHLEELRELGLTEDEIM